MMVCQGRAPLEDILDLAFYFSVLPVARVVLIYARPDQVAAEVFNAGPQSADMEQASLRVSRVSPAMAECASATVEQPAAADNIVAVRTHRRRRLVVRYHERNQR